VSEEVMLIVPGDHPLARRKRVKMRELADEQFISFREGARLRELLEGAGRQAGFEPQVKLESNESQRIRRMVARGMGVALLPRSDATSQGAEVAAVALTEPALARDITLAWRVDRRPAPAAAEFIDMALTTYSEDALFREATETGATA
jgi:LysR family transcriptional regulator, transcription activator of glutamate synthase operon